MTRRATTFGLLVGGIAIIAGFLGLNLLSTHLLRGVRLDATQGRQYTLTEGSKNIARSPKEPVTLKLYYSEKLASGQASIESYARRVRETLEEYERVSGGKVRLSVIDPEPFSPAEDEAVAAGLAGIPVGPQESLYFGLVGTNSVDAKETIPAFDPRRERLLEYDLSRMISSLATPDKPKAGVITDLPVLQAYRLDPRTRQPTPSRIWASFEELKRLYEVRTLTNTIVEVPEDITLLVVVHPRSLPEQAQYAIDQFVLRGGRLMLFVDPVCENDENGSQTDFSGRASNLPKLLSNWGLEVPADQLAADQDLGLPVMTDPRATESVPFVLWLAARKEQMNQDDAVTSQVNVVNFASSGFIRSITPGEGSAARPTFTPLITTTQRGMGMSIVGLQFPPDPKRLFAGFVPGTEKLALMGRLSGEATTAFSGGPPANADGKPPQLKQAHIERSVSPIQVLVCADSDVLSDAMWMRRGQLLPGFDTVQKMADNSDLFLAGVDNLMGSSDLIEVRARETTIRPFTKVEEIRAAAEQQYRKEELRLEEKLQQAQARINQLQAQEGTGESGGVVLKPETRAEIAQFREQVVATRKELRAVRLNLDRDIEKLGTTLRWINIAAMPIGVTIAALLVAFVRSRRRGRAA